MTGNDREEEVQNICEQVKAQGVEMLLMRDTASAAEHAFKHDWISLTQLHQVQQSHQEQRNN
ncbi:hypothetical protein GCM10027443_41840 [Pontibacter brevis]